MRRTTHFYVMVMSMFLLRLKGVRSDNTECHPGFDVALTRHNYSLISDSWQSESCIADQSSITEKVLNSETNGLNSPALYSEDMQKRVTIARSIYIQPSYVNTKVRQPSVNNIKTIRSAISSSGKVLRLVRGSSNVNRRVRSVFQQETRHTSRSRVIQRHEGARRRTDLSDINEIHSQRNVRSINEIRDLNRRQRLYNRQVQFMNTRLAVRFKSTKGIVNTRRENPRSIRQRQDLHTRYGIVERSRTTRRYNERNVASAEIFDKSLPTRKLQFEERRKNSRDRNENQIREVRNGKKEQGELIATRDSEIETGARNTEQQRRSKHNIPTNDFKHVTTRREIAFKRSHRETYNIAPRSSRRSLNQALPDRRRMDDTLNKRSDTFPISRHNAHTVEKRFEFRQMPELHKVTEDHQKISGRKERREITRLDEINGSRRTREYLRQTRDFRQKRRNNFRGIAYGSYGNNLIWGEGGISRAIVVGFVGILGRRLWQKQA